MIAGRHGEVVERCEGLGWEVELRGEAFEDLEADAVGVGGEGFEERGVGKDDGGVRPRRGDALDLVF